MKLRYLLPLLLLLPTLAAAQSSYNPFSCADVEILEPGWVCHEHFGFTFPDSGAIAGFLPAVGVDQKGSLYRGWYENYEPEEFCGAFRMRHTILRRYEAGYSFEAPARIDIARMKDKCVSSAFFGRGNFSRVVVTPESQMLLLVIGITTGVGAQDWWIIRLEREPVVIEPSPESGADGAVEVVLPTRLAHDEREANGVPTVRIGRAN